MRFDKETLFMELVAKHGFNLYLGAGFSVYARNEEGDYLPLGDKINERLIEIFQLDKTRKYNLGKTCQKIKRDSEDLLEKILKDTYRVYSFDNEYIELTKMPIKNIVTTNIDDLIEQIRIRSEKHERVLVTTLTKKMAEDLSKYLKELDMKVAYMHSDTKALERMEIIRNLRLRRV